MLETIGVAFLALTIAAGLCILACMPWLFLIDRLAVQDPEEREEALRFAGERNFKLIMGGLSDTDYPERAA